MVRGESVRSDLDALEVNVDRLPLSSTSSGNRDERPTEEHEKVHVTLRGCGSRKRIKTCCAKASNRLTA